MGGRKITTTALFMNLVHGDPAKQMNCWRVKDESGPPGMAEKNKKKRLDEPLFFLYYSHTRSNYQT